MNVMDAPRAAVVRRWTSVVAPSVVCIAVAAVVGAPMGDWHIARKAGELLLAGHLDVYVQVPKAQMGPLALVLAGVMSGPAYLFVVSAFVVLMLALATAHRAASDLTYATVVGGGMMLAWPWAAYGVQGHADEALVAVGAAGLVLAYETNRPGWLGASFLVAIAGKPTAIVLLPLIFMRSRRAGVAALVGTALIWSPFFLADPAGFLSAGRGPGDLWPGSLQAMLGAEPHTGFPVWVRPVQLVGGIALCVLLARFRGAAAAVVGVFALRTLLEPGAWNYYGTGIAAAGLMLDVRRFRVPVVTFFGFLAFATVLDTPVSGTGALIRMMALVAALATVSVFGRADQTAPSQGVPSLETSAEPTSDAPVK